jgi:hypothetical protein
MDAEIGFMKNVEKSVDAWLEMELTEVERLARRGRLLSMGYRRFEEMTSAEARKLKRKGKKRKANIFHHFSPQKTASNLGSQ